MRHLRNTRKLLPITLLAWMFVVIFIIFYGSVDDFSFLHLALARQIEISGKITQTIGQYSINVPAFYSLLVELHTILNLEYPEILTLPIPLIGITLIFYTLLVKYSSKIFASLIVISLFLFGYSNIIFTWMHGIGIILFWTVVLFLHNWLEGSVPTIKWLVVSIVTIVSLVYMSYRVSYWTLIVLAIIVVLQILFSQAKTPEQFNQKYRQLFILLAIGIVLTFGLNWFVYNSFIISVKNIHEYTPGITKIISSQNMLKVQYPPIILRINLFRTLILGSVAISSLILILFKITKKISKVELTNSILLVSLLFASILHLGIYNLLGHFDLEFFSFSTLIALAWIYNKHNPARIRRVAVVVIILLLGLGGVYRATINSYNLMVKDENLYEYISPSAKWIINFHYNGRPIKSDVLTIFYYVYIKTENSQQQLTLVVMSYKDYTKLLSEEDPNGYKILNFKLPRLQLLQWQFVKPPSQLRPHIECDIKTNKIYSSNNIEILL